jgi:Bacterial SH3 domain
MKRVFIVCSLLFMLTGVATAQDPTLEPTPSGPRFGPTPVYVTTQDFSSLRAGPGRAFERLTVVPATTTLPAYGRTADTQWIQVEYEGQLGWIASILLVWTGDVIALPVDGIFPQPFIRRAAALATTVRDTPYFASFTTMSPGLEVGIIPAGTTLELTGRVGERGYLRVQTRYEGRLVWIGTHNLNIFEGNLFRLLDLSYLFSYGKLFLNLQSSYAVALTSYGQILDVWGRIAGGNQVACAPVPQRVERTLVTADVGREPSFEGAVQALDDAIGQINAAISAFEDACAPGFVLTNEYVNVQLNTLTEASRSLVIVGSLIEPLRNRNPVS